MGAAATCEITGGPPDSAAEMAREIEEVLILAQNSLQRQSRKE